MKSVYVCVCMCVRESMCVCVLACVSLNFDYLSYAVFLLDRTIFSSKNTVYTLNSEFTNSYKGVLKFMLLFNN